ncbi:hypothetical protein ACFC08_33775 [Streptomyces sp. NPDC056112]|uniref:hypothetical protein n=1 Tax=Streptomyces sp. NPDC056112 TaxID=3345715 RepID=UPI0035E09DEE
MMMPSKTSMPGTCQIRVPLHRFSLRAAGQIWWARRLDTADWWPAGYGLSSR